MAETSGSVDFIVGDETYQTWYKVFGDLKSGSRPLVLIHGGPGIPHDYLLPHASLSQTHSIPVICYDQVGCGWSTRLPDKPKEFWKEELFMDELENLVARLGIANDFDVLGHSWGGMLATKWASTRHPKGLGRIVIVGTPASIDLGDKSVAMLIEGLPDATRAVIKKHLEAGTTEEPEFKAAVQYYFSQHICRLDPWPEHFAKSLERMGEDPTVSKAMSGTTEFFVTGNMKGWRVLDTLHCITQPTLVINGRYDQAQDLCVSPFFEKIEKVKWVQLGNSSHLPFFEEKERYFQILTQFLRSV
ncbi:hypothetical protein EIP86_001755 [Pleurotus ostreatoroseus]|nr:hypothetical protein EIP86_001755 [Pleurotus ostreatoroseus]